MDVVLYTHVDGTASPDRQPTFSRSMKVTKMKNLGYLDRQLHCLPSHLVLLLHFSKNLSKLK